MRSFLLLLMLLLSLSACSSPPTDDPVANGHVLTGSGCVILNYHRVREPNFPTKTLTRLANSSELKLYSVYTTEFAAQLRDLKKHGVRFVTADELRDHLRGTAPISGKCALVTFDDIDVSVYENAFPILKEEGIPFISFMLMGHIGDTNFNHLKLATAEQLKEMRDSGLGAIGVHTYDMHYFDSDGQPPFLNPQNIAAFQRDNEKSERRYEELFGEKPQYFAYPFGFGIPETDLYLLNRGYEAIFSLEPGLVHPGDPSFFVKRVLITRANWSAVAKWARS